MPVKRDLGGGLIGISPEAQEKAVEWLYLPDQERKGLVSALGKELLPEMARLADVWGTDVLKAQCDEELCNSIGSLALEKNDLPGWLAQLPSVPKFVRLLGFINQQAGEGSLDTIIEQMQTFAGAARLADRAYVIEKGQIRWEGPISRLMADEAVRRAYLSV